MGTLNQRQRRKNADGTYDTVHLETDSRIVIRPAGTTVEADLAKCIVADEVSAGAGGFTVNADTLNGKTAAEIITEAGGGSGSGGVETMHTPFTAYDYYQTALFSGMAILDRQDTTYRGSTGKWYYITTLLALGAGGSGSTINTIKINLNTWYPQNVGGASWTTLFARDLLSSGSTHILFPTVQQAVGGGQELVLDVSGISTNAVMISGVIGCDLS